MICTWRNCNFVAREAIVDERGRRWTHLCSAHARQLAQAADVDHPQWSAWRQFRASVAARGGWMQAARGWLR